MRQILFLSLLLVVPLVVNSQEKIPPGGTSLLPDDLFQAFTFGASEFGKMEIVPAEGQSFEQAFQFHIIKRPDVSYRVQMRTPTIEPVKAKDIVLLNFYARAVEPDPETGKASAMCVFELAKDPYTKSLSIPISVEKEWKPFYFPFEVKESYEAGKAQLCFRVGFNPQVLEIGGVQLINYGKGTEMRNLPHTRFTYKGREPDAGWRKEALERIEKIRKGDLTVRIVGAKGESIEGAKVHVQMKKHSYIHGSAVDANTILGTNPDTEKYREMIKLLFNRVVMEDDLKWGSWEANRERTIKAVQWLRENGLEVRGHCLVWPGWRNIPKDLFNLKDQPEALRKRIADHIIDEVSAMQGKIVEWDVINEPYSNKDIMNVLGNEIMVEWFKLAKNADSKPMLFLNDYPILDRGNSHLDHFEQTIKFLIEQGAPLEGIGIQCHYGFNPPPPEDVLIGLDRFAKFKLPIEATEFDVDTIDEELQADYMRDHLIAFFSHPATIGVMMWGFWQGRHWKPNAALFRKDWSVKPNGQVWMDLWLNKWWTDVQGKTDNQGRFATRGFLGDYEVTVEYAGKSKTVKTILSKESKIVQIELD